MIRAMCQLMQSQFRRTSKNGVAILSILGLLSLNASPVRAESSTDVFAAPPGNLQERAFGDGYDVKFVPKGDYSYVIQAVGKDLVGRWICRQYAAVDFPQVEWNKIRADLGVNRTDPNFSIFGEGDVVKVTGKSVSRVGSGILTTMHVRVVALAQGDREVYKTDWKPRNAANLTDWNQVSGCDWVAR